MKNLSKILSAIAIPLLLGVTEGIFAQQSHQSDVFILDKNGNRIKKLAPETATTEMPSINEGRVYEIQNDGTMVDVTITETEAAQYKARQETSTYEETVLQPVPDEIIQINGEY